MGPCPDPCSACTAENEADWIQSHIPELLETVRPGYLSPVLDCKNRGGFQPGDLPYLP